MDIETPCDRRTILRGSVGLAGAAAIGTPVSAQTDPYDGWFDDVDNYEGTVDLSGEETVEVTVGAGDQGLLFEPPAIQVDPGTTVVWEWAGEGGEHNVAEEDSVFESERAAEAGHTFEHTFEADDEGEVFRYVCTPHEALGMLGAVAVGDVVDETISAQADGDDATMGDDTATDDEEPGSSDNVLTILGGVLGAALLSPVVFALFMKYVYEDDSGQEVTH